MPYGAISGYSKIVDDGVTATSKGTQVGAGGTANTKGTYVTLIASTAYATKGIMIQPGVASAGFDYLIDIAIGAAASEVIIIPDLMTGSGTGSISRQAPYFFPIAIPAGVRISARSACTLASANVRLKVHLVGDLPGGMEPFGKVMRYGIVAATSQGTTIDPGGTANTKGAWVALTASTTYATKALFWDQSNLVQTTRTSADWLLDIGVGGAGAEVVIIPNMHIECSTTDDFNVHSPSPLFAVSIPAGTRIAARCMSTLITATVRNLAIGAYCFT